MDQDHDFRPDLAQPRGAGLRTIMLAVLVAMILGAGATYWAMRDDSGDTALSPLFTVRSDEQATPPAPVPKETQANPEPAASAGNRQQEVADETLQAVERVERVVEQQGGIDARVAAMEQRLTRLDLRSQAAAGNAARAEALLIAFATRRAIERGAPLGYLADQLRLRFGDARPNSVQTIIDAAQDPVTLDQLLARLDGLAETLMQSPEEEGVLQWAARELSQLFIVRREDTPSPVAERRLRRARLFLESGRPEAAVAEVRNLPNAMQAMDWITDAERYAAAQRALELLETTAVLEPRELRDGTGVRVEQRSPAAVAPPAVAN